MKITLDVPLANFTSLKTGGNAQRLVEVELGDDLADVLAGQNTGGQIWALGFGTNCLISDHGLPGTVILNRVGGTQKTGPTRYRIKSGVIWDDFIQELISENLWGLEFTSGIPGGAGAAIAGNIAAYGHKVADCLVETTVYDGSSKAVEVWDKTRLGFDYRSSALQKIENSSVVVLDALFELNPQANSELQYESALQAARDLGIQPDSLANRRQVILEARRRAGSLLTNTEIGPWTAGSFFKNPVVSEEQAQKIIAFEEHGVSKEQILRQNLIHGQNQRRVSAALVLLAAGFVRGQSWGKVRLNPQHILKLENTGGATSQEIYLVVQNIISEVQEKLGVSLEPEVRFLGKF